MSNTTATRAFGTSGPGASARSRTHLRVVPDVANPASPGASRRPSLSGATRRPSALPACVPAAEPPLRLTPRGRLVLRALVVLALVALMATTALVLARSAQAEEGPGAPVRYHVVLPGETLWGIATELTHGGDPRDTVAQLVQINHLPSSGVQAGERLQLPPNLPAAH